MSYRIRSLRRSGTEIMSVVFFVMMLVTIGCALDEVETELVENTFTVGSEARLVVRTENGSISVESSDSLNGRIQVTATIKNPVRVQYDATVEDNTVTLTGEVESTISLFGVGIGGRGGVDIVVLVPAEIDLNLKSSNGKITVDGVDGPISVQTSNGRLSITNSVGDISAKTSNGRITITDTSGQVDAQTSNGAIDFRGTLPPGSDTSLRTSNGGIGVELVNTQGVRITATTSNGTIRTAVPISIIGEPDENRLEGIIGDGSSQLKISTSNGSISFK